MLGVFAFLAVVGIFLLSGFTRDGSVDDDAYGDRVLIWGTLDAEAFRATISNISTTNDAFRVVEYRQVDERSFNDTFVNALAEGRSPDLILLSNTELVRQRNRLLALSYEDTISLRDFRDKNVDGAEIFARADGVYALPLVVDPIVMYWNRDIFASNGLAQAPTTWEYIVSTIVPTLTRRDDNRNILMSALAFGEVRNVRNAKELLLLLAIQSGSKLISEEGSRYVVELDRSVSGGGLPPLEAATQFYSNFSNSNGQLYSWNRSQPVDRNAFVSEDLAMYFGFGSELSEILEQNPNLNFDVAPVPQGASATILRTYGEFYGFAIPKASPNVQGAYLAANVFTQPSVALSLSERLGMAPVERTAIAAGSNNAYRKVVMNAALIARSWLDPNTAQTDMIFQDMIEDVTSGRKSLSSSVNDAEQKVQLAF